MNDTIILNTKREPVAIVSPEFTAAVGNFLHLFGGMFRAHWQETRPRLNNIGQNETFLDSSGVPAKGEEWPLRDMLLDAHRTLDKMMLEAEYNSPLRIQTTTELVNPIRRPFEDMDGNPLPF